MVWVLPHPGPALSLCTFTLNPLAAAVLRGRGTTPTGPCDHGLGDRVVEYDVCYTDAKERVKVSSLYILLFDNFNTKHGHILGAI